MSFVEIEAELDKLDADELRLLALKSWTAFVREESCATGGNECDETDPEILNALDEAIAVADGKPGQGHSAADVRARLGKWISG